jgi:hypothetical protein
MTVKSLFAQESNNRGVLLPRPRCNAAPIFALCDGYSVVYEAGCHTSGPKLGRGDQVGYFGNAHDHDAGHAAVIFIDPNILFSALFTDPRLVSAIGEVGRQRDMLLAANSIA